MPDPKIIRALPGQLFSAILVEKPKESDASVEEGPSDASTTYEQCCKKLIELKFLSSSNITREEIEQLKRETQDKKAVAHESFQAQIVRENRVQKLLEVHQLIYKQEYDSKIAILNVDMNLLEKLWYREDIQRAKAIVPAIDGDEKAKRKGSSIMAHEDGAIEELTYQLEEAQSEIQKFRSSIKEYENGIEVMETLLRSESYLREKEGTTKVTSFSSEDCSIPEAASITVSIVSSTFTLTCS